ncbi:MAG TPA: PEP-CTERM sorting domain-containing protein, partial [Pirellulales bacterium]|nr:PEP-CTERM sorting domain-containing protein [Pirellulales bacterium]
LFETPAGATLTEGSFFDLMSSANGLAYRFEIGYRGDSAGGVFSSPGGNDLVLRAVAIPEPATIALLLAAVGVVVLCRVVQQHRDRNPQTSGRCALPKFSKRGSDNRRRSCYGDSGGY